MKRNALTIADLLPQLTVNDRETVLSCERIRRGILSERKNVPADHMRLLLAKIVKVRVSVEPSKNHTAGRVPISFQQIAEIFDISAQRVSQLLREDGVTARRLYGNIRPRRYLGHAKATQVFYVDRPKCPFCGHMLSIRTTGRRRFALLCRYCLHLWTQWKDDDSRWGGRRTRIGQFGATIRWTMKTAKPWT